MPNVLPTLEQELQNLHERVRIAYVMVKNQLAPGDYSYVPRWDGGTDNYGAQHKPAWPKLSAFLVKNGCDPFLFFRAQIVRGQLPLPHTLTSQHALAKYAAFRQDFRDSLPFRLRTQIERFKTAAATAAALYPGDLDQNVWRRVLLDDTQELSPLFRCCIAASEQLPEVYCCYYSRALGQTLVDVDGYLQSWGQLIPPQFASEVNYLRQLAARS